MVAYPKWAEYSEEIAEIREKEIRYERGFRYVREKYISVSHDDVLYFAAKLLEFPKFRRILKSRYPIIFIDEYQDTDKLLVTAILQNLLSDSSSPMIGLFGDHWQKIYRTGSGYIKHDALQVIQKHSNFRSVNSIVQILNRIRPELIQHPKNPDSSGFIAVFHTNSWSGGRLTSSHWRQDLPRDIAKQYFNLVIEGLKADGWDFAPEKTKVLMLTHKLLAEEQGYKNIEQCFKNNESFAKKEDEYIKFFVEIIEPLCHFYETSKFGEMFLHLGYRSTAIRKKGDKERWQNFMQHLIKLRVTGAIKDVVTFLQKERLISLSDGVEKIEHQLTFEVIEDEPRFVTEARKLREIAYQEIIALSTFLDKFSLFSTKHGVKGAEFEEVLIVLGRGWNQYNFGQFLEWAACGTPNSKEATFVRNRNLFYVACSRAKVKIALLFTQELSEPAVNIVGNWFGNENIRELPDLNSPPPNMA